MENVTLAGINCCIELGMLIWGVGGKIWGGIVGMRLTISDRLSWRFLNTYKYKKSIAIINGETDRMNAHFLGKNFIVLTYYGTIGFHQRIIVKN